MKTRFLLFLFSSLFLLFNHANAAETELNNTLATANTLALNGSNSSAGSQTLNVSSLAAGIYMAVLHQNNQQQSLRFVKW